MVAEIRILDAKGQPMRPSANYSGAGAGFGGQMSDWTPSLKSSDAALLPRLDLGNARADDLTRNNGIASGSIQIHIDNIVGHNFRLSYKPVNRRLRMDDDDMTTFRGDVEALWKEEVEDQSACWFDAERKRTFTMMVREVVGTHATYNEAMAFAGWDTDPRRPCRTTIKMVSPKRISNPNGRMDDAKIRGGVHLNLYGAPIGYYTREQDASNWYGTGYSQKWTYIPRETAHGRANFLHIFEPTEDGQTRAANHFLRVMEQLHMLPKLQHTKLQNAIVNAMYAACIETELGTEAAHEIIGALATDEGGTALQNYLTSIAGYHGVTGGIKLNGVKIPHLLPQERLHLQTSGNVDNGFTNLEESILRWTARGLNVPYEALAQNYSKTSYSSARASMLEGWRYFMGRRKIIASRFASSVFGLWLEEKLDRGHLVMPRSALGFYEAKSSWCNAEWIGSGRLAIDGLKEVKEAVLRIESGLSTYEKECALLGEDYQEIFDQQVREMRERKAAGLPPPSWAQANAFAPDEMEEAPPPANSDN